MTTTELVGILSGVLVFASVLPYSLRVFQKKIKPVLVSWGIWSVLGLAILLTFKSSGAEDNVWPAVFGFSNPLLVTILAFWRGDRRKPNHLEYTCLALGLSAIAMWVFIQHEQWLVQYALFVAITADALAVIPTIVYLLKNPMDDRPLMWMLFSVGYGLSLFASKELTLADLILPTYMLCGGMCVAIPLLIYRVRRNIPVWDWL